MSQGTTDKQTSQEAKLFIGFVGWVDGFGLFLGPGQAAGHSQQHARQLFLFKFI